MAKKIPAKLQIWRDVRRRYHLSDCQLQMARELGMSPKKMGRLANDTQERWKIPLPVFIEELYFKRFGRRRPGRVISIEELSREQEQKKVERKMSRVVKEEAEHRESSSESVRLNPDPDI